MKPCRFTYSNVCIAALGYELPPAVVLSEEIEETIAPLYRKLRLQKGQLAAITGVRERRFWHPGEPLRNGAIAAGKKALEKARIPADAIGMLVYCGVCRENLEPATACAVADGLGVPADAMVYDTTNACLGVVNGMLQAANAIALGQIDAALVVSCESAREIVEATMARMMETPDMALLRKTLATLTGGSGAAAVLLVRKGPGQTKRQLLGGVVKNAVRHHELCIWGPETGIPATGPLVMETDAVGVLKNGVLLATETYREFQALFDLGNLSPNKIVCHQVGSSHQKTLLDTLGIPAERDFTTFSYLGNIGTVSLPITAAIAEERGFFDPGDLVGFFGIGSGLNCLMLGVRW